MRKRKPQLVLGKDYIIDTDGRCVLTHEYLKSPGTCCGKDCRYCPYPQAQHVDGGRLVAVPVATQN